MPTEHLDKRQGVGVEVKVIAEVDGVVMAVCTGRVASEHWAEESEDGTAYVESVNYEDLAKAITNITQRRILAEVRRRIGGRTIRQLEATVEEATEALEAAREEAPA
jgi:hypothetical protein